MRTMDRRSADVINRVDEITGTNYFIGTKPIITNTWSTIFWMSDFPSGSHLFSIFFSSTDLGLYEVSGSFVSPVFSLQVTNQGNSREIPTTWFSHSMPVVKLRWNWDVSAGNNFPVLQVLIPGNGNVMHNPTIHLRSSLIDTSPIRFI